MKRSLICLLIVAAVTLGVATSALAQVNLITVEEAWDMINNLSNEAVLDVRTQSEYDAGHLHDAVLIPLAELESRLGELEPTNHCLLQGRNEKRTGRPGTFRQRIH